MSEADRVKWDRKWAARTEPVAVSPLLLEYTADGSTGRALDLACGRGQNALALAEAGYLVDAIDISSVALAAIDHPRVRPILADLDSHALPESHYDLILDAFFYDARLLPEIRSGIAPGGLLIFQTFSSRATRINPAFTVDPAVLRAAFTGFELLHEHIDDEGILSFVARKPGPA